MSTITLRTDASLLRRIADLRVKPSGEDYDTFLRNAADIIDAQAAEIERLKVEVQTYHTLCHNVRFGVPSPSREAVEGV